MDTDIDENNNNRWITGRLYQGFFEERIAQEMVLGIGGVRALRALSISVDVYHLNEGHAVLAGLELMKEKIDAAANIGIKKILSEDKIGIIVSLKRKQYDLKKAEKLKKKLEKNFEKKKVFIFLTNNVEEKELENFPIKAWINTACPSLQYDFLHIPSLSMINSIYLEKYLK